MTDKYYTPEIEEFFYEVNYGNTWVKDVQTDGFLHNKKLENIRVKYLDKEDIESLGWKYVGGTDMEDIFEKDIFTLVFHNSIHHLEIVDDTPKPSCNHSIPLFIGTIKNKSELKKLMKQLNILLILKAMVTQ